MRTAPPLPAQLIGVPFTTAQAREAGVDPRRLRSRQLHHPFHAVHSTTAVANIAERCRAYLKRMPGGALFSHQTAAELLGVPLPAATSVEQLHVSVAFPRCPPRGRGVIGHSLAHASPYLVDGFPVCAPSEVWVQLSGILSPEDLVAAGDHLLGARRRAALATVDELTLVAQRSARSKGAKSRAWALSRIRPGADSRPESLLRLFLTALGVGGLQVNAPVPVAGGALTLHPDLTAPSHGVAFEYEGDGHRVDPRQWRRDIERQELLEEAGWRVIRVTASDLFVDRGAFRRRLDKVLPDIAFGG